MSRLIARFPVACLQHGVEASEWQNSRGLMTWQQSSRRAFWVSAFRGSGSKWGWIVTNAIFPFQMMIVSFDVNIYREFIDISVLFWKLSTRLQQNEWYSYLYTKYICTYVHVHIECFWNRSHSNWALMEHPFHLVSVHESGHCCAKQPKRRLSSHCLNGSLQVPWNQLGVLPYRALK